MSKRIANSITALAMFAILFWWIGENLAISLALASLSYIGSMLYDIHAYLEKISKN